MQVRLDLTGATETRETMLTLQRKFTGSRLPVMTTIAGRFAERIRERMRAGVPPPLSPVTLKMRKGGGSTPLIDSGGLLGSIATFVSDNVAAAGSTKTRANWMQLGITTGAKSAIPNKRVPGRPFILVDLADENWALEQLANFLFGEGDRIAA